MFTPASLAVTSFSSFIAMPIAHFLLYAQALELRISGTHVQSTSNGTTAPCAHIARPARIVRKEHLCTTSMACKRTLHGGAQSAQ